MNLDNIPSFHGDPRVNLTPAHVTDDSWVDLTHAYVTNAVHALVRGGVWVEDSWLDPRDPRDATIVYSLPRQDGLRAAVWDEVTGWRHGRFIDGHQGIRTIVSDTEYLGGGVLPSATEFAGRLRNGVSETRCEYRAVDDLRDGMDDMLRDGQH